MSRIADVVVLGGGVAGMTVALAAAERGLRVTLIDEPRRGAASRPSAGLLAPGLEGLPDELRDVANGARDCYPPFLARLRDHTGIDVPLDRSGILEVAADESELAALDARRGPDSQRLGAPALAALEPALASHAGALLHRNDGAVDNVQLMTALERSAELNPLVSRVSHAAVALELTGAAGALVLADGDRHVGANVVLAGGAWAGDLGGLLRTIPVVPLRGQLARVAASPLHHVTFVGGGYLVPRGDQLVVGATSEWAGFDSATTPEGIDALRRIAGAVPALRDAAVVAHWAGLRPMTPDGLPILGPDPDHPALYYACGYSRNGILLAPWAAERIADLLAGAARPAALAPFAVGRF